MGGAKKKKKHKASIFHQLRNSQGYSLLPLSLEMRLDLTRLRVLPLRQIPRQLLDLRRSLFLLRKEQITRLSREKRERKHLSRKKERDLAYPNHCFLWLIHLLQLRCWVHLLKSCLRQTRLWYLQFRAHPQNERIQQGIWHLESESLLS